VEEPPYYQSLEQLSSSLDSGETTAVDLMDAILDRTRETEDRLHSFISFDGDDARKQARESDRRRREGKTLSRWDGIPIAIKDLISVKDQPLTCGSRILGNYISPYDATVIDRLKSAGMVIWGRTNLDEFAMGSSTETSAFGPTSNPWDIRCVPGGSSGGSASAVAAGQAPVALGTDTGGSVRQPAALCGITGLKPSYGRVSRYGVTAFASSLDQVGPLGRSVEDVAIIFQILAGRDDRDFTSADRPTENFWEQSRNFRTWTIGIPGEFFGEGLDPMVEKAVREAIAFYESKGCRIVPVHLPHAIYGISAYYILAPAEAFSNLARFDGIRYGHRAKDFTDPVDLYRRSRAEGFGAEVKRRNILGAFVLSGGYQDAYYLRAQKVRTRLRQDYEEAFRSVDVILTPTSPTVAFPIGSKAADPLAMYLCDVYSVTVNIAGLPAISIPCGFNGDHLPIGLQLIGKMYGEGDLLAAANFFQRAHDYHHYHPNCNF
jgi:aspartyl-tRNA(Asn)/glutamyl-tRNA(Gln) amidotransferase subunit A